MKIIDNAKSVSALVEDGAGEVIIAPFVPDEDHYIFVSYSHADRERVFPIITRLYEQGWHIWYDQGIELNANYYVELAQHTKNCEVFLLFTRIEYDTLFDVIPFAKNTTVICSLDSYAWEYCEKYGIPHKTP